MAATLLSSWKEMIQQLILKGDAHKALTMLFQGHLSKFQKRSTQSLFLLVPIIKYCTQLYLRLGNIQHRGIHQDVYKHPVSFPAL